MQAAAHLGNTPRSQSSNTLSAEQEDEMELSALPDTVLLSVLDFLAPKELAGTCCLVSKSMRDAALSSDLWRKRFRGLPKVRHSQQFRGAVRV